MRWSVSLCGIILGLLLLIASVMSITQGAMALPASHSLLSIFDAVFNSQIADMSDYQRIIVLEIRLPRLALALLVGAILSQCGAVMQGLFRNPLADPSIIGVSSGAAVGAVVAIVLLPAAIIGWALPLAAFFGGLITTLLIYHLARSPQGTSVMMLLLAGIAISALANAIIGYLSYFSDDQSLRQLNLWQMGALSGATYSAIALTAIVFSVIAFVFQKNADALNAILLGESEARHLGINIDRLKLQLIVLTALGVGVAVAFTGIIGFIGLVVPHLVRISTGSDHRTLLPLSALCGAALLALSDLVARLVVSPAELPVGLVTAMLGAPFFLILLIQQKKQLH